ncbi:extracellular solute-binding protein [Enterococcus massiliensis]|uniref:extracellular solute-binding protein n=1 Tax=Enterococcus massiliensis TaxID=1640685 RepID=UPI00065E8F42|nr:extracellular solute-binding protein [Enterococcus massiliensis]
MKKRYFAIASLLLATTLLGACGSTGAKSKEESNVKVEETGMPIVKETLKMSMMAPGGQTEWDDMASAQALEKLTGIDFDYITPPSTDFRAKLNLAFASDELPDVIFGAGGDLTAAMQTDYGSQGILLPLEDLIEDYAPNLNKVLEENPDFRKSITAPDGHIYSLPRLYPEETSNPLYISPLWYNGDWMEALGIKELPKTTDELYTLLKRFKEEDPNGNGKQDEIPLSDGNKLLIIRHWLLPAFGMKIWGIEEVDGVVRFAPSTENYKEYLTFMNRLYSDGLLDKEVFSQSAEQFQGNTETNKVGLFGAYASYMATGKMPEEAITDPMFQQLTSDIQDTPLAPGHPRVSSGTFAITHKCKSPEAAMRWADYLYTDEGADLMSKGPEGTFWEYETNDAGDKVRVYKGENLQKMEEDRGKVGMDYGLVVPGLANDNQPNAVKAQVNDPDTSVWNEFSQKEVIEKVMPYAEVPFPIVFMTKDESDKIAANATDITTYVEQMEAKFITGVESLDNWDNYTKTLDSMGLDEYISVYQQAYDRWEKAE